MHVWLLYKLINLVIYIFMERFTLMADWKYENCFKYRVVIVKRDLPSLFAFQTGIRSTPKKSKSTSRWNAVFYRAPKSKCPKGSNSHPSGSNIVSLFYMAVYLLLKFFKYNLIIFESFAQIIGDTGASSIRNFVQYIFILPKYIIFFL